MAASPDTFCDICTARARTVQATKWCPECEEALCTGCVEHHSISKLSRSHVTINVAEHQRLPEFVCSIRQSCEDHKEKFQLFCTYHDVACCGKCVVNNHFNCKGVVAIMDLFENAKTSSSLQDVEEILIELRKNIEVVVKNRELNRKNVQSKFQYVKDMVKTTREKILKHLDKLEKKLMAEIENKEAEVNQKTETVLKEMEIKDLKVKEYQDNVKVIKEYGTNIQVFFGTREVAKYVQAEEKSIYTLFEDGTLNNDNAEFQLQDDIGKCLNADIFGFLHVTSTETYLKPVLTKVRAAQIDKAIGKMKPIEDITLTLKNKFCVPRGKSESTITGCDVTPGGKIVFADCNHNKRLVVHKSDGTYISEVCNIPDYAFDVAVIDEQRAAISSGGIKCIKIVNMCSNEIIKRFNTTTGSWGIAFLDGNIISGLEKQGIMSNKTENELFILIKKQALSDYSYVTCFHDNIYYTNTMDNSVTCLTTNGEVNWTFTDSSLLKEPRSITTDKHGNVYILSLGNKSVVVISADGKHCRKILEGKDGLNNAWAMCCDKIRNMLVVANFSGDVFVFDIL